MSEVEIYRPAVVNWMTSKIKMADIPEDRRDVVLGMGGNFDIVKCVWMRKAGNVFTLAKSVNGPILFYCYTEKEETKEGVTTDEAVIKDLLNRFFTPDEIAKIRKLYAEI